MFESTLADIAAIVNGEGYVGTNASFMVHGVSIDSRTVRGGELFIPIRRVDNGHRYVEAAISQGAAASLWQKSEPNAPEGVPLIYVDDTLDALQCLAAAYRKRLPVKVVAVTGSNGKTTTKDLIDAILATTFSVYKTKGNLNSRIGLPLSLLEIDPETEVAVLEMGMSEPGQIARLSEIAAPDIAVITMIGLSHLSSLGSREQIAAAKREIAQGLRAGGTLVVPGDEPLLSSAAWEEGGSWERIEFGVDETYDYGAASIEQEPEGIRFWANRPELPELFLPLLGKHNVHNALAAIAVADRLGIPGDRIARGLKQARLTGMRMEKLAGRHGSTIINDAWNASPASMEAAIDTLREMTGYARKIAMLGDMLELGADEAELHRVIGRKLAAGGVDYILTVGDLARHIAVEAMPAYPAGRVFICSTKQELLEQARSLVGPGDLVLVKASRGMALEEVVQGLLP